MIHKAFVQSEKESIARVTFTFPSGIWADRIYLVGDFDGWNRTSHPLQRDREGQWSLTIDLPLSQVYQFRYLCDGERWVNDRQADDYVLNPYGSNNFVVRTDPPAE